jgi:hypothetical protein
MRLIGIGVLLAASFCFAQEQGDFKPATSNGVVSGDADHGGAHAGASKCCARLAGAKVVIWRWPDRMVSGMGGELLGSLARWQAGIRQPAGHDPAINVPEPDGHASTGIWAPRMECSKLSCSPVGCPGPPKSNSFRRFLSKWVERSIEEACTCAAARLWTCDGRTRRGVPGISLDADGTMRLIPSAGSDRRAGDDSLGANHPCWRGRGDAL